MCRPNSRRAGNIGCVGSAPGYDWGKVEAGVNLLAHLHEDQAKPVAAVSSAARTNPVLLFTGRKRLAQADSPDVVVEGIAMEELGVIGGQQLLAQDRPREL